MTGSILMWPGPSNVPSGYLLCDGNSYYTGNPKYVYDSSVYTRYKQLKSVNKTYDDKSFGGSNNGAYTFLLAVRRF
jgi:hypothetical protein